MKIKTLAISAGKAAYTLAEVMIAVLILAIMMGSLYGGFSTGFSMIQVTRENLRATQIMVERMETIRLYRWDQVINNSYITPSFTNYYYPDGIASGSAGVVYTGSVTVANMPISIPSAYTNSMRQVSVSLGWKSGKVWRKRDMNTFVARYGLQNYVYDPASATP
jgi:prepilin-type N-terminal cleavage/methylation domain-containing protein